MSSSFLESDTSSYGFLKSVLTFFIFTSKLSLIAIVIYTSPFEIGNRMTSLWAEWKKFIKQVQMVSQFPGLNIYPDPSTMLEYSKLLWNPSRDILPWTKHMTQKYGPIFRFWIFGQAKMFICCAETAIQCLQNETFPNRSSDVQEVARVASAVGLIVLKPEVHKTRKKQWKMWFTRKHINGNHEMFQREAKRLCDVFSGETETFDAVPHVLHCTFRIITSSAFGEDYVNSIPTTVGKEHFHCLTTFSHNITARVFRPWLANNFMYYNLTASGREAVRCVKIANELTEKAIKDGKHLRNSNLSKMDTTHVCFLDHLLDIHEKGELTENEVLHELNDFIVGGYDTTGLSICWVLYMLSLHKHHQTKVFEELDHIFGGNISSQISAVDLQAMRHLELCIKETLRFYPVTNVAARKPHDNQDAVMPDGKIVPPFTDIYIHLRIIHQDPKYFPEPEKFIPERHLKPIPAFIPFGNGSRNCIGQVYAIQEMKMVLANLLMEYKWETVEKPNKEPLLAPLSYPENGLHFKISKRNESI